MSYGRAAIFDSLGDLKLTPSQPVIYDRPIGLRLLYTDPVSGAEHYLVRYPVGLEAQPHRHSAAHTILVLEGRLQVNDRVIGPGSYCHFPGGEVMYHGPVPGEWCLFPNLFDGPFDVEPVAGFDGPPLPIL